MLFRPKGAVLVAVSLYFLVLALAAQHQLASIMAVGNDIMINTVGGKGRVVIDGDQDLKAAINALEQENKDLKVSLTFMKVWSHAPQASNTLLVDFMVYAKAELLRLTVLDSDTYQIVF
jgi:hypothetical protein